MALSELLKCVVAAFLVIYFPQWGLISFSIAQVSVWRRERERERVFTYMSHTYINSFCGIFPQLKDKEADIVI